MFSGGKLQLSSSVTSWQEASELWNSTGAACLRAFITSGLRRKTRKEGSCFLPPYGRCCSSDKYIRRSHVLVCSQVVVGQGYRFRISAHCRAVLFPATHIGSPEGLALASRWSVRAGGEGMDGYRRGEGSANPPRHHRRRRALEVHGQPHQHPPPFQRPSIPPRGSGWGCQNTFPNPLAR